MKLTRSWSSLSIPARFLILTLAALPHSQFAHAKTAWIKATGRVELKAAPTNSSPTGAMLSPGEEVELLDSGQGVWAQIKTKRGNSGYVIRYATSTSPLASQAGMTPSNSDLESNSMKQLRARRSSAATMGVRGLQARTDSGEAEKQDFSALEKMELNSKELEADPTAQQLSNGIRKELTPP